MTQGPLYPDVPCTKQVALLEHSSTRIRSRVCAMKKARQVVPAIPSILAFCIQSL